MKIFDSDKYVSLSLLIEWLLFRKYNDAFYLKLLYRLKMRKRLNLETPVFFNEKLQWLKLYNRQPIYTTFVDKYSVKQYVANLLGEEFIIPTLKVWESFDDVNLDMLPDQFVLKTTNGGGGAVAICKDKKTFDKAKALDILRRSQRDDIYRRFREWPYKDVKFRILAEKYMEDESGSFIDYKFFCFDGYVDCVMVCVDRQLHDTKFYFFDKDWKLLRLNVRGKNAPADFSLRKPECLDQMFEIASRLSRGLPFVRVDLYECFGKIYFGEMTFFPDSGFDANLLQETDEYFGKLLDLSKMEKIGEL